MARQQHAARGWMVAVAMEATAGLGLALWAVAGGGAAAVRGRPAAVPGPASRRITAPASHEARGPIVAAFYTPWQKAGIHSLRAHASQLSHVMPEWLHVNDAGNGLDLADWDPSATPRNLDVVQIARRHGVEIHPVLNNADGAGFDAERVHRLLVSPLRHRALARAARDWLLEHEFHGLNLALARLRSEDYRRLPEFVGTLAQVLGDAGLALSLTLEAGSRAPTVGEVAEHADFVVLMAYDRHTADGVPGPIAPFPWFQDVLERHLRVVPRDKLVVGIGNYAYDWAPGGFPSAPVTYQVALLTAQEHRGLERAAQVVRFDSRVLNPTFSYVDRTGRSHRVWMLDAVTAYNQRLWAGRRAVAGAALWALGFEDPSVWLLLDRRRWLQPVDPRALEIVEFPYALEPRRRGDIMAVSARLQRGRRRLRVDSLTGLVTHVEYVDYPSSSGTRRRGYPTDRVALFEPPALHRTPLQPHRTRMPRIAASIGVEGLGAHCGGAPEEGPTGGTWVAPPHRGALSRHRSQTITRRDRTLMAGGALGTVPESGPRACVRAAGSRDTRCGRGVDRAHTERDCLPSELIEARWSDTLIVPDSSAPGE